MIQDLNIIPKSLEVAGWIGGAGFTMWLVRQSWGLFKEARKSDNGKANAETIKKAVEWGLHMKEQGELTECAKKITETQTKQAQLLEALAKSYDRQTDLLAELTRADKRG